MLFGGKKVKIKQQSKMVDVAQFQKTLEYYHCTLEMSTLFGGKKVLMKQQSRMVDDAQCQKPCQHNIVH